MTTPRVKDMDPIWKERWLEALRSGKYKQGRTALKTERGDKPATYCCIGVLCQLLADEELLEEFPPQTENGRSSFGYEGMYGMPHHSQMMNLVGVSHWSVGGSDESEGWLPALNDDFKLSFLEIADRIEAAE